MKRSAAVAAVLAVAALAAGCGRDDDGGASGSAAGGLDRGVMAAGTSAESVGGAGAPAPGAGITVVGTGSVTATPDTAEWSFGVQTSADTAAAALAANSTAMEKVVAALRDAGVAKDDLQTEQVSVYPRTSDDGTSIVGYDASNTVRATIRGLDKAGALVDAAVAAGANQVYGPSLRVSDAEAQYAAAMEEAYDDAHARAQAIAEKAGVSLGAPIAIVEGGGGEPMPYYARAGAEMAAADVAIEPGTQDLGATLTVTFAIQ
jgi:uncharacterized protein YggE